MVDTSESVVQLKLYQKPQNLSISVHYIEVKDVLLTTLLGCVTVLLECYDSLLTT